MKKAVFRPGTHKKSGLSEDQAAFRMSFGERLSVLLDRFPTRAAASGVAGVNVDMLAKYVKGEAKAPLEVVARLCEEVGSSLDWLAFGAERADPDLQEGPLVMVPVWDVVASSGAGTYHISEELQGHLAFSRAWLLSLNFPVNDLHVVFNAGDSNAPAINDGDAMLIQRGVERLVGDAFYIFDSGGVLLVKEIERRADGSVVLRSRNPEYQPQVISRGEVQNLHIFGRVLWAGGLV